MQLNTYDILLKIKKYKLTNPILNHDFYLNIHVLQTFFKNKQKYSHPFLHKFSNK
jgi:hypothetical protein